MQRVVTMVVALLIPGVAWADNTDDREFETIIDAFGEAIIEKDKTGFLNLFVDGPVSWVGVRSERQFTIVQDRVFAARESGKQVKSPEKVFYSSPEEFIDWIASEEDEFREEFKNIRVLSDGEVAAIYFDYEFYRGEKRENWGSESWHLAKTAAGWKIHSVNFSYTRE